MVGVDLATEVIVQLLREDERLGGLIYRGPILAQAGLRAATIVGRSVPDDLEIVFDRWSVHSDLDLPHARAALDYKDQAKLVGKILRDLIHGKQPDPQHVVLPVDMDEQGLGDNAGKFV